MPKAALLDRDNTLIIDEGFTHKATDLLWKTDAISCMSLLHSLGFKLIVITNQSGIAMGHYDKQRMDAFHEFMNLDINRKIGVSFDGFYYCPHHPNAKLDEYRKVCQCRKPGDLLYKRAIKDFSLDPKMSLVVGDRLTDLIPAFNNGIERGFLLSNNRSLEIPNFESRQSELIEVENWDEIISVLSNLQS